MEEKYREAFSELEQIIQIMPTTLKDKIPEKLKKMIKDEKSKSYITKIKEPIKDPMKETALMAVSKLCPALHDLFMNEIEDFFDAKHGAAKG